MENVTETYTFNSSLTSSSTKSSGITDTFYISLFLMYIPGIVTNLVSVTVIVSDSRRSKAPTNSLLLLLCVTDFIAVALSCFWHTSKRLGMPMTFELCAVKSFFHPIMPLLTGTISLMMAMDRVLAFCRPFYYRTNVNKRVWYVSMVVALSLLSLVCVLPHLGFGSLWTKTERGGKVVYSCSVFQYQEDPGKRLFHVIYTSIGFLMIVGIVGCNAVVVGAMLLLRHRTMEAQKSRSDREVTSKAREIKFALIVAVLACVFVTCWLPYNVWVLYKLLDIPMDLEVVTNIHLLGGFNYSTDPFVYLIIRKSNRKLFGRIFCCRSTVEKDQMRTKSISYGNSTEFTGYTSRVVEDQT